MKTIDLRMKPVKFTGEFTFFNQQEVNVLSIFYK
jgi:hypothetical protein